MATSILDKVRVAVLGKMHELLDEVANTPEAYKQRIRDLENALADLRAAGDVAQGDLNGIRRRQAEIESKKADALSDIDLILGDGDPSNDEAAITLQERVGDMEDTAAALAEQAQALESERAQLLGAVEQLEAKHRQMVHNLSQLSMKQAATAAKNRAVNAAEAAEAASNAAGDASIDSIQANAASDPEAVARRARAIQAIKERQAKIADAAKSDS